MIVDPNQSIMNIIGGQLFIERWLENELRIFLYTTVFT